METVEIEHRARHLGIVVPAGARKAAMIRAIQRRLGQPECFATDARLSCPANSTCAWRADCLKPIAEWLR